MASPVQLLNLGHGIECRYGSPP